MYVYIYMTIITINELKDHRPARGLMREFGPKKGKGELL